jgi:hypothetical protein
MMYYRAILEDKRMEGHLLRADAPVRYSNVCRDLSTVISQDHIATHSEIGSREVRQALASSSAVIAVWRADDRGTVARIALSSPEDSKEWPTVYIRGSAGLRAAVSRCEAATGGGLEYIGEWHSHPGGCYGRGQ